jgi:hypothetical protein
MKTIVASIFAMGLMASLASATTAASSARPYSSGAWVAYAAAGDKCYLAAGIPTSAFFYVMDYCRRHNGKSCNHHNPLSPSTDGMMSSDWGNFRYLDKCVHLPGFHQEQYVCPPTGELCPQESQLGVNRFLKR